MQDFSTLDLAKMLNFQEVQTSVHLVPKHFLTVGSVFVVHWVVLESYSTGIKKR